MVLFPSLYCYVLPNLTCYSKPLKNISEQIRTFTVEMRGIFHTVREMICLKKLRERLLTELMNRNIPSRQSSGPKQPSGGSGGSDGTSAQQNA